MKMKMIKSTLALIILLIIVFITLCSCGKSQIIKINKIEPESVLYKRYGGVAGHIYNLNGDKYLIVSNGGVIKLN